MDTICTRRLVIAALATAALLAAGCAGLPTGMQPPSVTLSEFGVGNASLFEQQFDLKLRIQNPNREEFRIDGIAFDLEINGHPFAKGVGGQDVTVPGFSSAFMNAEAVSTLTGILRQFGRLTELGKFSYRIKGTLALGGGQRVPFEEAGEFDFKSVAPKGLVN